MWAHITIMTRMEVCLHADRFHYLPADCQCSPQFKPINYQTRVLLHLLMKSVHPNNDQKTSRTSHQVRITLHFSTAKRLNRVARTWNHAQRTTLLPPQLGQSRGKRWMKDLNWLTQLSTTQTQHYAKTTRVHTALTRRSRQADRLHRAQGKVHWVVAIQHPVQQVRLNNDVGQGTSFLHLDVLC